MQNKGIQFQIKGDNVYKAIIELLVTQQASIDFLKDIVLNEEAKRMNITYDEVSDIHANWMSMTVQQNLLDLYERLGHVGNIDDIINDKE